MSTRKTISAQGRGVRPTGSEFLLNLGGSGATAATAATPRKSSPTRPAQSIWPRTPEEAIFSMALLVGLVLPTVALILRASVNALGDVINSVVTSAGPVPTALAVLLAISLAPGVIREVLARSSANRR